MGRLIFVFSAIAAISAALALMAAVLIVASFFLAGDRAASGYLGVHLGVAAFFLVLGLVLGGTSYHARGVSRALDTIDVKADGGLTLHLSRLFLMLVVGGIVLLLGLALVLSGILSRIGEGYAVFG
jgi:heme/copper-type cytochrome/quinol oxidase subunit 1